jgi:hypothetical protein
LIRMRIQIFGCGSGSWFLFYEFGIWIRIQVPKIMRIRIHNTALPTTLRILSGTYSFVC